MRRQTAVDEELWCSTPHRPTSLYAESCSQNAGAIRTSRLVPVFLTIRRSDERQDDDRSGGLAGYDEQVDVSIYLALELILVRKLLNAITLKTASQKRVQIRARPRFAVAQLAKIT